MASVVFLRAANVGGTSVFRPSVLAKELADLDVVSIGAAGTFVVRRPASAAAVRARVVQGVRFRPEMMVRPGKEVLDLVADPPFGKEPAGDVSRFVSVLAERPTKVPPLPIVVPLAEAWQVKVVAVPGPYALSWDRHDGKRRYYPNEVVERHLGVRATTRGWDTLLRVARALEG